jgi:uncharacterized membrane protein (UPF0127 family)
MILKINDNKFKVMVMMTQKDTQKGMMGRDFDSNFNGMLFLMDKGPHGFWMKDCIIPLDIIFIDGNTITKIHHSCPPCKSEDCPSYVGTGDTILELRGGTCGELSIKEGDKILY